MEGAWRVHGGGMVGAWWVAWWLHGGCMVGAWWVLRGGMRGGCTPAELCAVSFQRLGCPESNRSLDAALPSTELMKSDELMKREASNASSPGGLGGVCVRGREERREGGGEGGGGDGGWGALYHLLCRRRADRPPSAPPPGPLRNG